MSIHIEGSTGDIATDKATVNKSSNDTKVVRWLVIGAGVIALAGVLFAATLMGNKVKLSKGSLEIDTPEIKRVE